VAGFGRPEWDSFTACSRNRTQIPQAAAVQRLIDFVPNSPTYNAEGERVRHATLVDRESQSRRFAEYQTKLLVEAFSQIVKIPLSGDSLDDSGEVNRMTIGILAYVVPESFDILDMHAEFLKLRTDDPVELVDGVLVKKSGVPFDVLVGERTEVGCSVVVKELQE